jgi:hypothetical protein
MKRRRVAQTLLAAALFSAVGCSLLVDTSDVDQGCGPNRKACGAGNCVSVTDPAYGCTQNHCEPCSLLNATSDCLGETCVVKACLVGFGCPNESGCPANILAESDNCGDCGVKCEGGKTCSDGKCVGP